MAGMLTDTALNSLREHLRGNIAYAKFKVGSTYYEAPIEKAEIVADKSIAVSFVIDHQLGGDITVTEAQLYDKFGNLWASKAESITRKADQEGIFYRFRFTITEG